MSVRMIRRSFSIHYQESSSSSHQLKSNTYKDVNQARKRFFLIFHITAFVFNFLFRNSYQNMRKQHPEILTN
jgi:hypothetical protein